jgi:glucokinase-like ROK family protein
MREMNIALILECLRRESPRSRAELAAMTGLTKATVSSLVRELLSARFVRESGIDLGHKGRPAIKLVLNAAAGCIIGVEIGVDFISAILTDFSAQVIWHHYEPAESRDQSAMLKRATQISRDAATHARDSGYGILGLGIGVPGLVDVASGTLLFAPNLGWSDVPLRRMLESEFRFPIYVDNEANMAALGESYFGAGQGSDFVLYISAGVGLGGGFVVNRRILAGAAGLAGEVGHMSIDPNGARCSCGSLGCWETFVSEPAIVQRILSAIAAGRASSLQSLVTDPARLTVPVIVEAARQGDSVARAALEECGHYMGVGVANLINAINPHQVIFGGSLSMAHEFILPVIKSIVDQRALRWARENTEIVIASHGRNACAMGGIAIVYHHALARPSSVPQWNLATEPMPSGAIPPPGATSRPAHASRHPSKATS